MDYNSQNQAIHVDISPNKFEWENITMKVGKLEIILRRTDTHPSPLSLPFETFTTLIERFADSKVELTMKIDSALRAETILTEEFRRANIEAYQASDDVSQTFYAYLIGMGIAITGITALAGVIQNNSGSYKLLLEIIATILLILVTFISYAFRRRFSELDKIYRTSTKKMQEIKQFYVEQLEQQMPDLKKAIQEQPQKNNTQGIPLYIESVIWVFASFSFGGAIWSALAGPIPYAIQSIFPVLTSALTSPIFNIITGIVSTLTTLASLLVAFKNVSQIREIFETRPRTRKINTNTRR
jgi:hypothetical protein